MRLFGLKLNSLLVIAVAAWLALGTISAFADSDSSNPPADAVTVDDGDTDADDADDADDTDDDVDANDADGDVGLLSHGDGPNPERGCATGSLDDAREVLGALLGKDHPGENAGIQNALDKMCHGDAISTPGSPDSGEGDGGGSEDNPGNGNAFGRGHGQGKPAGVPTNDGGDE